MRGRGRHTLWLLLAFSLYWFYTSAKLSSNNNFCVKFVQWQANMVDHNLSRTSNVFASHMIFTTSPSCISLLIDNEMPWALFTSKKKTHMRSANTKNSKWKHKKNYKPMKTLTQNHKLCPHQCTHHPTSSSSSLQQLLWRFDSTTPSLILDSS